MSTFVSKKDNLSGNCVIGTGSDVFYLGIHHRLLSEAIASLLNDNESRAALLIKEWKEATGRIPPSYS